MKNLLSKYKYLLIIVIIILIVVVFVLSRKPAEATKQTFVSVTKSDIKQVVSSDGVIEAEKEQSVFSKLTSKITDIKVSEGDKVNAGGTLAILDKKDLDNALKSAGYSLNAAIYNRDKIKAAPVYDDNAYKAAQQQVNIASVNVETAKNNLANATITSPIDGTVVKVNNKIGDSPTPTIAMFIVSNIDTLRVSLNINQVDIIKVKVGNPVEVSIDAINATREGILTQISTYPTTVSGIVYYNAKAVITDINDVKIGMSTNVQITTSEKTDLLTLPISAIKIQDGKSYVEKLTNNDENKPQLSQVEVQTGISNDSNIEITSGLNDGDKVLETAESSSSSSAAGLQLFNRN